MIGWIGPYRPGMRFLGTVGALPDVEVIAVASRRIHLKDMPPNSGRVTFPDLVTLRAEDTYQVFTLTAEEMQTAYPVAVGNLNSLPPIASPHKGPLDG